MLPIAAWYGGLAVAMHHDALSAQANERGYLQFVLAGSASTILRGELRTIWLNIRGYGEILSSFLSGSPAIGGLATATFVTAFVGGAVLLRRTARALVLSALITLGVILVWPSLQDRLIVPLLPFAAVVAVYAVHVAIQALFTGVTARRLAQGIVTLCGALVLVRQVTIRDDVQRAREVGRPSNVMTPSAWLPGNAEFVVLLARWVTATTRPDDRIAVASAPGVWLYSGRVTEPTEFAEPEGLPSVFDVPGRYLTGLIASGRVTVVVVESPNAPIAGEVTVVRRRCPRSLTPMAGIAGQTTTQFFRVMPDSACIDGLRKSLRDTNPPTH